jgi:3-hydroxyacyl-CoA dehydrogenase
MDLKQQAFRRTGARHRPNVVLALEHIDARRRRFRAGQRTAGTGRRHHFFSPANVMKLLEVVRAKETSAAVLATSVRLARRLGKIPVDVGNCFGFVATGCCPITCAKRTCCSRKARASSRSTE